MSKTSFNYYGFDRETYRDCLPQIRWTNIKHMMFMNSWFLFIAALFMGIRIYDSKAMSSVFVKFNMNGLDRVSVWFFVTYVILAAAFELLLWLFTKHPDWKFHYLFYVNMLLMVTFCYLVSMAQQMKPAVMFHVTLVLISVTYIDTVVNMGLAFVLSSVLLLLGSYHGLAIWRLQPKPLSIALEDVFNTVLFLVLSLVLHYTQQRTRMQQFVTYLKNLQITRELEVKSSFDALTSLLNRGRFMAMAGEVLRSRRPDEYIVICLLDLDSFKQINDKLGHQMGDKAIQLAGQTIIDTLEIDQAERWSFPERAIREKLSFAGRLGGDEFIVLMRGEKDQAAVRLHMQNMLTSLNTVDFGELHGIHASFGVTEITEDDRDIDKAYSRADDALYQSKRAGKNQITFNN